MTMADDGPATDPTLLLQAQLVDAQGALHKLLTGAQRVSVTYDGQEVRYTPASVPQLRAYIAGLKSQLGMGGRARGRRLAF